ncbi:Embryo defective protein [Quillaja saponaria]|uniref:Embryo defective protein n=1 Tax=Quillaja saponaria TaxID=32244 RepID=A0AAD7KZI6_QUISA|nr:Embryo defective protein [Quillaja saponaria]
MSRETDRFLKSLKKFADSQYKLFSARYGQQFMGILEFPIKLLSYASIFAVATLGTYDFALELGKKVIRQRSCRTCNGWQALRGTMCRGSGRVRYQVKSYALKRGMSTMPKA